MKIELLTTTRLKNRIMPTGAVTKMTPSLPFIKKTLTIAPVGLSFSLTLQSKSRAACAAGRLFAFVPHSRPAPAFFLIRFKSLAGAGFSSEVK